MKATSLGPCGHEHSPRGSALENFAVFRCKITGFPAFPPAIESDFALPLGSPAVLTWNSMISDVFKFVGRIQVGAYLNLPGLDSATAFATNLGTSALTL